MIAAVLADVRGRKAQEMSFVTRRLTNICLVATVTVSLGVIPFAVAQQQASPKKCAGAFSSGNSIMVYARSNSDGFTLFVGQYANVLGGMSSQDPVTRLLALPTDTVDGLIKDGKFWRVGASREGPEFTVKSETTAREYTFTVASPMTYSVIDRSPRGTFPFTLTCVPESTPTSSQHPATK
jgi:hypothetical protein